MKSFYLMLVQSINMFFFLVGDLLPIHKRLAKSGKVIWQAKWPSVVVAQTILCRSIFQLFFLKNKVEMFIQKEISQ